MTAAGGELFCRARAPVRHARTGKLERSTNATTTNFVVFIGELLPKGSILPYELLANVVVWREALLWECASERPNHLDQNTIYGASIT